jgi:hypothetical protein
VLEREHARAHYLFTAPMHYLFTATAPIGCPHVFTAYSLPTYTRIEEKRKREERGEERRGENQAVNRQ